MGLILDNAIIFAVNAHRGQLRKGSSTPYILHPMEAAAVVGTMTADDEILAAAVLHDTVEDTGVTVEQLREQFGEHVAALVAAESENKREDKPAADTWKIRKEETIEHLKTAPTEVKMLTLGDKLSNIRSMYRDHLRLGDELWQRFNQKDKNEHRWYYESLAECLSDLSEYPAYREYTDLVAKVFAE
mgnify:CR=1 FL=1